MRKLVSAVGGDREKRHGIILAKSYSSKEISHTDWRDCYFRKRKMSWLDFGPSNYDLYNRSSKALIKLLSEYTDKIESIRCS